MVTYRLTAGFTYVLNISKWTNRVSSKMLYELSVRGDICETHIYQLINSGNVCFKLLLLGAFFRCSVGACISNSLKWIIVTWIYWATAVSVYHRVFFFEVFYIEMVSDMIGSYFSLELMNKVSPRVVEPLYL